jgi:hypothetical protein
VQLQLANNGPNLQQMCVNGVTEPFGQPPPVDYTVTATVNPTVTSDCQPGGQKTYSITNTASAVTIGAAGATVTAATDPVQITVTCPLAAPVTQSVALQSAASGPALVAAVGGFKTYVSGEHAWTADVEVDSEALSLGIGQLPKTLSYRVKLTKRPASDTKFYVAGIITVTNPGDRPVEVTAVSVTAGAAAVRATCPEGVTAAAPGAPLVCNFNVTWNRGPSAGALGARVDTPDQTFTGDPAQFDFTNPTRGVTRGTRAEVFDDFEAAAPRNATGVPTKWFLPDGGAPPPRADGVPLTADDSREYEYAVQIGPFVGEGSCGTYSLTNLVTLVPSDTDGASVTAKKDVAISVTGCKGAMWQEASTGVTASLEAVATTKTAMTNWEVATTADPGASVKAAPGKAVNAKFTVKFSKVPSVKNEVTGTVRLSNTNPSAAIQVARVSVSVEPTGAAPNAVDATCNGKAGGFEVSCVCRQGWNDGFCFFGAYVAS